MARGKRELEEGRAVLHEKRNHVARPDLALSKPACGGLDAAHQLPITDALLAINQRYPPGRALGVEPDEAGQGDHRFKTATGRARTCDLASFDGPAVASRTRYHSRLPCPNRACVLANRASA